MPSKIGGGSEVESSAGGRTSCEFPVGGAAIVEARTVALLRRLGENGREEGSK